MAARRAGPWPRSSMGLLRCFLLLLPCLALALLPSHADAALIDFSGSDPARLNLRPYNGVVNDSIDVKLGSGSLGYFGQITIEAAPSFEGVLFVSLGSNLAVVDTSLIGASLVRTLAVLSLPSKLSIKLMTDHLRLVIPLA